MVPSHVMTFLVVALVALWMSALWWKPSWFLHPRLTYHRLVLRHKQEMVPVDFADWDIHCECGIKGEL